MFLSIIIPVYNAEVYIDRCIGSLIAAGIEDIELICVDDGSTDSTTEKIEAFCRQNKNIRLLKQKNSGPSAARNHGLEYARGEFITFVDADDYVNPPAFAQHISMLRGKSPDIWASDFVRVADNACVLDRVYQIRDTDTPIFDADYLQSFLAAEDCVWNVWRYIFRREFLGKNNLRFAEGYSIAEDLEFVVRVLSLRPNMAFFHEPYYFYRVNYGASLTRIFNAEKIRQLIAMISRAMESLGDQDSDRLIKSKLAREYILNLSALYELKKTERSAALNTFISGISLMEPATGVYKCAAKAVKILGIPAAAYLLYMMKRMKRLLRGIKTKIFNRGEK